MTVGKRENEKKRIAKREEKLKKKENKKLSGSSNSFEDMIAYVDENGRITSTPPTENVRKEEINPDEMKAVDGYSIYRDGQLIMKLQIRDGQLPRTFVDAEGTVDNVYEVAVYNVIGKESAKVKAE